MDSELASLHFRIEELKAEFVRLQGEIDGYREKGITARETELSVSDETAQRLMSPQKREDRFQSLANNLNIGFYRNTPGPEGHFIEANSAIVRMFGFDSEAEFLNSRVVDHYQDSNDRNKFNENMKHEGFVLNKELRLKRKDGTFFIGSVSSVAVKDASGKLLFYDGVIMDVTEQKQAKDALVESEVKFRSLFDLSPQAIALVHMESSAIEDVNDKFCQLFKLQRTKIIGKSPVDLGFYTKTKRNQFTSSLEKTGKLIGFEMNFTAGDGSILNTLMFSRLINIKGEEYILTIFHDQSEQKRLESQLQQAQKMEAIGALAGGIAHDFNNILSAITGYIELAILSEGSQNCDNELKEALKASNRAKDLVKQILAFSRQTDEERMPVRVGLVVEEAVKFLRATIPTTIDIKTCNDEKSGAVLANTAELHQIVMNLCTNAVHAIEGKEGILQIDVQNTEIDHTQKDDFIGLDLGPYTRVSISDTGAGIHPEALERIFDPYFTTKEKGVGTGLGLAVVHGIVKKYGGAIKVESKPGKGSTFHIYLPRVDQPAPRRIEQTEIPLGGSERILFVDDEKMLVDIAQKVLNRLGYDVAARTSPIEALELFKAKPDYFDLVITDQTMPGMTGDLLAKELMRIRPDLPVIICTGYSQTIDQKKADDKGIKGFVMKPILINDIADAIRKALNK
jgi:two-component system, cell cycle sensor histidine kinase and response regulator CckA